MNDDPQPWPPATRVGAGSPVRRDTVGVDPNGVLPTGGMQGLSRQCRTGDRTLVSRAAAYPTLLVAAVVTVLVVGCRDAGELAIQQIEVALASGRPDRAMEIVKRLERKRPDDTTVMLLKARTALRLGQFDGSRQVLVELLHLAPEHVGARRQLVHWTWAVLGSVLKKPDFLEDPRLQDQFDEAIAIGLDQVQWFAGNGSDAGDAHYFQARYAVFEADRLRLKMKWEKQRWRADADALDTSASPRNGQIDALVETIDARLVEAITSLEQAVMVNPRHDTACELVADLLVQRRQWPAVWALVQRQAQRSDLSARTAAQLVAALLQIPPSYHHAASRLAACWQLQASVTAVGRQDTRWQLTSARLHLSANEPAKAKPLIESALQAAPKSLEGQHLLARALYGLGQYDQAIATLAPVRSRAPDSSQVQMLWGLLMIRSGQPALARVALRRATEINPTDAIAGASFLALLAETGELERDDAELDQYLRRCPDDLLAIRYKINIDQARGNHESVLRWLERVEAMASTSPQRLRLLIDGFMLIGRWQKAQAYAQHWVDSRPDEVDGHVFLARCLLMQGQEGRAKQLLQALQGQFPDTVDVQQVLGTLYLKRQSFDLAIVNLEQSIQQHPGKITSRLLLAETFARLSRAEAALEQVHQVLAIDPHAALAHGMAFRIYQMAGHTGKANEHLSRIDDRQIDESANAGLLAQIRIRQGRIEQAAAICHRAIAHGQSDPVLRLVAAAISLKRDDKVQAEHHMRALVRDHPDNPQAYVLLGRFYVEQGWVEQGLKKMAVLRQTNEPFARMGQAVMLLGVGRPQEAVSSLEQGYGSLLRAREPMALLLADLLATAYRRADNRVAATAVYDRLIEADLHVADARLRQIDLAGTDHGPEAMVEQLDALAATLRADQKSLRRRVLDRYRMLGRSDRAMSVLNQWRSQQPDEAVWAWWSGRLSMDLGRPLEAVKAYEQAVTAVPGAVGFRVHLAQAHAAGGNWPACERVLLDTAALNPPSRRVALGELGRMYLQVGLHLKAVETFQELAQRGGPADSAVRYAMARVWALEGFTDRAAEQLALVPVQSTVYGKAQMLLVRLEQQTGRFDQARSRLVRLVSNEQTQAAVLDWLSALGLRSDRANKQLLLWADAAVNTEGLAPSLASRWLSVRLSLKAEEEDWGSVLALLEQNSPLSYGSAAAVAAGRVAVMIHLKQLDQARQLYRNTAALRQSKFGPPLAVTLALAAAQVADQEPEALFLQAVAGGDLVAARRAAGARFSHVTLYASDLLSLVDRADAGSEGMAQACTDLCLAWVANEVGLSKLGETLSRDVIQRLPDLVAAHALYTQACLNQSQPIQLAWHLARRVIPDSSLALFLSAHDKNTQQDHWGAASDLKKLLDREPALDQVRYGLANRLQKVDRVDEAIDQLQELVRREGPYKLPAANDLARLLVLHRRYPLDQALATLHRSLDGRPAIAVVSDTLGWIEHLRGNNEVALRHLHAAATSLSALPEVQYHLGVVYQALGEPGWAHHHFMQAAGSLEDRPEVHKARAVLEQWGGSAAKTG